MKKYYKRWLKSLDILERVQELGVSKISDIPWSAGEGFKYWNDLQNQITDFKKLIKRVKKIDPQAAKYLKKDMWKKSHVRVQPRMYDQVCESMIWSHTPQGYGFWENISKKLGEYTK